MGGVGSGRRSGVTQKTNVQSAIGANSFEDSDHGALRPSGGDDWIEISEYYLSLNLDIEDALSDGDVTELGEVQCNSITF